MGSSATKLGNRSELHCWAASVWLLSLLCLLSGCSACMAATRARTVQGGKPRRLKTLELSIETCLLCFGVCGDIYKNGDDGEEKKYVMWPFVNCLPNQTINQGWVLWSLIMKIMFCQMFVSSFSIYYNFSFCFFC